MARTEKKVVEERKVIKETKYCQVYLCQYSRQKKSKFYAAFLANASH